METAKYNYAFILILMAIAAVGLGFWLVIIPQLNEAKANTVKAAGLQHQTQTLQERLNAIRTIDQAIKTDRQNYDLLTTALPAEGDVGGALIMIEAIAARSGASVVSIDPAKEDVSNRILPVIVHLRAGYANVIDFMNVAQKNLRPITIQSATISKQEGGVLDVTFALQLLFAATPANVTPTESPLNGENGVNQP